MPLIRGSPADSKLRRAKSWKGRPLPGRAQFCAAWAGWSPRKAGALTPPSREGVRGRGNATLLSVERLTRIRSYWATNRPVDGTLCKMENRDGNQSLCALKPHKRSRSSPQGRVTNDVRAARLAGRVTRTAASIQALDTVAARPAVLHVRAARLAGRVPRTAALLVSTHRRYTSRLPQFKPWTP